ncbi:uncharacterized protein N7483_005123 [Penicillium malachiteum]|uniref:uncharacterized protein n=1 Tax=Penicillium malachiteum TaxID=1324776 RepID=UPI00254819A1|nr:uncharacterized protein N7483_005123 [Penicillium malachiteum]KAJ5730615.1 hypothetical protein N7483_005123 [Penicillium malachiteum]
MQILLAYNRVSLLHQQLLQERIPRFLSGAAALHQLFVHDTLLRDHRWRLVKRQLKSVCKGLEESSTTISSGVSSGPDYTSLVNTVESAFWAGTECQTGHTHQAGSSTQDLPGFNLDLKPSLDDYFTGQQYENYTIVTDESLEMHMFQNATPLTSLWNE